MRKSHEEDIECIRFHEWLTLKKLPHTHIPNESYGGTYADMLRGKRLKSMGRSPGVWDYEVYIPKKDEYRLIKIEMKKKTGGNTSTEQKAWGEVYQKAGIPCRVCKGVDEAIKFVEENL